MTLRLIIGAALIISGCGGNVTPDSTEAATTTALAPTSSVAPDTTKPASPATTVSPSVAPAPSTLATTTTRIAGDAAIRIDEVVFAGEPYLVLANKGTGAGSTAGLWICQFPAYFELPAFDLLPGERLAVPLGDGSVPSLVGVVGTVDVVRPIGAVGPTDGEVGLYQANQFNSPAAIVDYLEWGSSGHARSGVAVAAGIWTESGFVDVPPEVLAIVAQAFPTVGPEDFFAEIGG